MTQRVSYVELDIPYCSLVYAVPPCLAGTGIPIGNMTAQGGIAAARDGVTVQAFANCARLNNSPDDATIGIDWGGGSQEVISSVTVYGPSDQAIVRNSADAARSVTMFLEGSDDGTNWTQLGSIATGTSVAAVLTLTADSPQIFRYIQVRIPAFDSSSDRAVAEIVPTKASTPEKCFNTKATCQYRAAYTEVPITLRFAVGADFLPRDIDCDPCIESIEFTPGEVSLGGTLGERSVLTVELKDHRHPDTGPGFDKYYAERSYNPFEQGTIFGKFRARQPFLPGASVRWIQGEVGQAIADMETRLFIVDSTDGPNENGIFRIIAKDPLKLLDGERAVAPLLSTGFLASAITDSDTSASLNPAGIGNAEYPASGTVCIGGNELCTFTRSGNTLTLVRARFGSVASAHDAQDRVQLVLRYTSEDPADIISDLETTYAGVPASYITVADWQQETGAFNGQLYTAIIPEPTPVKQLVEELLEQAGLVHWWDDVEQQIRLNVIRPISSDAKTYSDRDRLAGSLEMEDQPEKRVSRVQTYFALVDPTKGIEDLNNFRSVEETIDTEAEDDYGAVAIKAIKSRWIPQFGGAVAQALNGIVLSRFRTPPRRFAFEVLRGEDIIPALGFGYKLSAYQLQDAFGAADPASIQVTRLNAGAGSIRVEAEELLFDNAALSDPANHVIVIDNDAYSLNLRTRHDAIYGAPTSGDTVTCIINNGVTVGSTSTSRFAFDTGDWPNGVTVELQVNGRIQGKGGKGGRGAHSERSGGVLSSDPAEDGGDGGPALKVRYAIELSGNGEVWGGGGAGGGGGAAIPLPVANGTSTDGGGGGGGQGTDPGAGAGSRGDGEAGHDGTANAAGNYGEGGGTGTARGLRGGAGGTEGAIGENGRDGSMEDGGVHGAAGKSIEGNAFVTETGTVDVQGPRT